MHGSIKLLLKILVSAGLMVLLAYNLDIAAISHHLLDADWLAIATAFAITLAASTVHAARWRIVLSANGAGMSYPAALQLTLIGYFFNQTLPSSIGGDAFRIWGAYRAGLVLGDAVNSVILDRVVALAALLLMITLTMPWLFELIEGEGARSAIVALVAAGAAAFAALLGFERLPAPLLTRRPLRLVASLSGYGRKVLLVPRHCVPAVMLTIAAHCIAAGTVYVLAIGMDVSVSLFNCLLLFPLVIVVSVLPVSIAGWGVREGAMVVALGLVGVTPAAAFSLSVLYGLVAMASGMPGGLLWLATGRAATLPGKLANGRGTPD